MRDMQVISKKNRDYIEKTNPCLAEEGLTRKCLEANNYENIKCERYFENVKKCKEFWYAVKRDRRIKGVKPELPYPEERAQIKAKYLRGDKDYLN